MLHSHGQFLASVWQSVLGLLHISQIPDFLKNLDMLEASELFFKLRFLINRLQTLLPDYRCAFSLDSLPADFDLSVSLTRGLSLVLEALSMSFKYLVDSNSQLQVIQIMSLTTVLMRFEEKNLQKYFIKMFRTKIKQMTRFDDEIFWTLVHWFDAIEYIFDFLTSELQHILTPSKAFEIPGWFGSALQPQSKILHLLSDKLGFSPDPWILSFFLNFDQRFFNEEILNKASKPYLWCSRPWVDPLPSDSKPTCLLRSRVFSIRNPHSPFCISWMLHHSRLSRSAISSLPERKALQETLVRKREDVKQILKKILSDALYRMTELNPSRSKELIMTKKTDISPDMFKRLLQILDFHDKKAPTRENPKIQPERDATALMAIPVENQLNMGSNTNRSQANKSKERFSVYRKKVNLQEMRQQYKKGPERLGTRSPMRRRKEWRSDKFHSEFGVKDGRNQVLKGDTSEFKFDDGNRQ